MPYLVFGVAGAVIYSLMYSTSTQVLNASATTTYYQGKAVDISFCDQLVNLALGGWHELGFVGNSVLWFIPALFSVELVAQVVVRLADWCGRRKTVWVGVMVLALGVYASRVGLPKLPWALGMAPKYLPYFILGSFMGLRGIPGGKKILLPVAVVAVVAFGWLAVINPYQWHERAVWQFGISIALAVANIVAWQVVAQLVSFKALAACGVASMGIMLMHKYPMLLVQNYFAPVRGLFGGGTLSMFFGVAVVFVCAVVMCLVGCKVLGRWLPWVLGEKR